jgi:hypothetical protein
MKLPGHMRVALLDSLGRVSYAAGVLKEGTYVPEITDADQPKSREGQMQARG